MSRLGSVGLAVGRKIAPERVPAVAVAAEQGGFDELWLGEELFFTGGIAGAAIALAATERLRVGLGVVSAVVRHPALLATEISTISRTYPSRLITGVGLGEPRLLHQMGLFPSTQLGALRECVTTVKRLLQGETMSEAGRIFTSDGVKLSYPDPGSPTPVHMGVVGPKMLRLSGEISDGSVLSVAASHAYVEWARSRINEGREVGGRTDPHRITVLALYSVEEDGATARRAVRESLAYYKAGGTSALTDVYGISEELQGLIDAGGQQALLAGLREEWVEDLTIAGTPRECAEKIAAYHAVGADSVALLPVAGDDELDRIITLTAQRVLPAL